MYFFYSIDGYTNCHRYALDIEMYTRYCRTGSTDCQHNQSEFNERENWFSIIYKTWRNLMSHLPYSFSLARSFCSFLFRCHFSVFGFNQTKCVIAALHTSLSESLYFIIIFFSNVGSIWKFWLFLPPIRSLTVPDLIRPFQMNYEWNQLNFSVTV